MFIVVIVDGNTIQNYALSLIKLDSFLSVNKIQLFSNYYFIDFSNYKRFHTETDKNYVTIHNIQHQ